MSGQQPPSPSEPPEPPSYPGPPQPPPYPGPPPPPPYLGPPPPSPYAGPPQQPPYPGPPPYPGAPQPPAGWQPAPPYGTAPGYPYAPPKQPLDATARLIGALIVVAALVIGVAAFLTWWSGEAGLGTQDFTGVSSEKLEPAHYESANSIGALTLVLAIPAFAFGIVRICGALSLTAAIIGVVTGSFIVLIGLVGLTIDEISVKDTLNDEQFDVPLNDKSIGIGLWLTLAAGVVMLGASIAGLVKRR